VDPPPDRNNMHLALVETDNSQASLGGFPKVRGSFSDPRRSSGSNSKASLFSCIINLANTVMGTGLLALPRAFGHSGWVWGLAFSTLSCVLNIVTSVYISESCRMVAQPASFKSSARPAIELRCVARARVRLLMCGRAHVPLSHLRPDSR
jgi:hypothetical protein